MSKSDNFSTKKANIIIYGLLAAFLAVVILLVRWQVFDSERFVAIANERYRNIKIPTVRGSILASDGSSLAYSEPRFDVYVWLPELELAEENGFQTRTEFIEKVAKATAIKQKTIEKKLDSGPQWVKIADKISVDQREALLELRQEADSERFLQGMQINYVNKRIYPEADLASHLLGFLGLNTFAEAVGVGGLEQYWDGSLKPFEGFESGEFDSFGNPITLNSEEQLDAKPGVDVYTAIDKTLQKQLEESLEQGLKRYDANNVTGIIMDPKTGAIMAMATYPDFDPNKYFEEEDGTVFGNQAITVPYEIGSVAKVFTLAAAIDSKNLTPTELILPEGHDGCEVIQSPEEVNNSICFNENRDSKIECICTYDRGAVREPISVADALITSDNIAFRHIALSMKYDEFHDYLEKFGIGRLSGIDLSGESTGLLKPAEEWNYADQAVYSYGHSYQVTPLQAITGIAAVANEGKRMQPYIVEKVVDSDGNTTNFNPRIIDEVISPAAAGTVTQIMHEIYNSSLVEYQYRDLNKYYIAMKSGTALIPYRDKAGYSDEINATYVGFDASPEKKFIMLIKLEEPKIGDLSFYNARLLWLDTFMNVKDTLGVPEYTR